MITHKFILNNLSNVDKENQGEAIIGMINYLNDIAINEAVFLENSEGELGKIYQGKYRELYQDENTNLVDKLRIRVVCISLFLAASGNYLASIMKDKSVAKEVSNSYQIIKKIFIEQFNFKEIAEQVEDAFSIYVDTTPGEGIA